MALNDLTTEAMIAISSAWLDPERTYKTIARIDHVKGLLPAVAEAHKGLVAGPDAGRVAAAEADESLAQLNREARLMDRKHDRKSRGVFKLLGALADLCDDESEAGDYLDLQDHMFPTDLAINSGTYLEQAGNVRMVAGRLSNDDRALLRKIPLPHGRKLMDAVDDWFEAGNTLGDLENRRVRMEIAAAPTPRESAPTDPRRARTRWLAVAKALRSNLALEPLPPREVVDQILGDLRRAEASATRRSGGGSAKKTEG